jgi:hypothetical protein
VDFIEMTATSFLREAFKADRVGIWHVDLAGTGSYCLADAPAPPEAFHDYALRHPVVARFRDTGSLAPLRDSDLGAGDGGADAGADAIPGTLAIPLAVGEQHVRLVSISRVSPAFSTADLLLADRLQPVLAGIWPVKRPSPEDDDPIVVPCGRLPARRQCGIHGDTRRWTYYSLTWGKGHVIVSARGKTARGGHAVLRAVRGDCRHPGRGRA